MSIKIGHASIDENGKISGGKVGDQTTKEICVREWYNKPWNVYIECKDKKLADKAVSYMKQICGEKSFGYDQSKRVTGYLSIIANGGTIKKAKGCFDCSSLVSACYKLAGLDIAVNNTTLTLRKALLATGKFIVYTDSEHITSDKFATPGGIYLSEGHHVVMALENGSAVGNPYSVPIRPLKYSIINMHGDDVKFVQWELRHSGIKTLVVGKKTVELEIDGEYGKITKAAVEIYQRTHHCKVDGKVWTETLGAFKKPQ